MLCARCHTRLRALEPLFCIISPSGEVLVFCTVGCMEKTIKFKDWRKQ